MSHFVPSHPFREQSGDEKDEDDEVGEEKLQFLPKKKEKNKKNDKNPQVFSALTVDYGHHHEVSEMNCLCTNNK